MAVEIEAAADLVTAGLVAHEIEGESAPAHAHAHAGHGDCLNCSTPTHGRYCSNCGQSTHLHRSVLHLVEELAHGIFHFETKGWRTLPMLITRPGQLTRRYIDGQRTRFVSPLALFLFMVFLMFFVFSFTSGHSSSGDKRDQSKESLTRVLKKDTDKLVAAQAKLEQARAAGKPADEIADLEENVAERQKSIDGVQLALAAVGGKAIETSKTSVNTGVSWLDETIGHAVANPELAKYKLKNAASKYSILLVPISMPFLWLMFFWRRGVTMYDHAVFSLYSLSFMALLMIVCALLSMVDFGGTAALLFCVAPPLHMYKQLRGTYGLKRWEAMWRTWALLLVAAIVLGIYAAVVLAMSTA